MKSPIPDYRNLDASGEAEKAAWRMEMRARCPASQQMFEALVVPLLGKDTWTVLEWGCGTAALSRRIVAHQSGVVAIATDASETMLDAARAEIQREGIPLEAAFWDVRVPRSLPGAHGPFDLVLSSVAAPYLSDTELRELVKFVAKTLAPHGVLAFLEQDLMTDSFTSRHPEIAERVLDKASRKNATAVALRILDMFDEANLERLPVQAFLWSESELGPYVLELLSRMAAAAEHEGRISSAESVLFLEDLQDLADDGKFRYSLNYVRLAARNPAPLP